MKESAKTMNISLPPEQQGYVRELVESGRYGSASEVVRTGLRLLEERETKLADLRRSIQEGLESGPPGPVDMEEVRAAGRRRLDARPGADAA